ncbi:MAG: hypothetical protein AMQ74_01664 [Candidatus Methanofastidiosum methylothiophilum]|uniref:Uncharacterized protein n=1 Tax=Candidatus Methanofastidiosum methylothiophilum TaxID=1705564 RepID=A0A150ISI4_9EURY|nr:MAG: hypothetical protein AMQ74_01664 [Candidatus Methanofastidiosum methylthiophilus]
MGIEIKLEDLVKLLKGETVAIQLEDLALDLKYKGRKPKVIVHIYDGITQSMSSDIPIRGVVVEEDGTIDYAPEEEEVEFSKKALKESKKMKDVLIRKTFVGHL